MVEAGADPTATPPFLAAELAAAGYDTVHFGKYMVGEAKSVSSPRRAGFAHSFGTIDGANGWQYYPSFQWLYNSSAPASDPSSRDHVLVPLAGNEDQDAPGGREWLCQGVFNASGHACSYNQDEYARRAAEWILAHGARNTAPGVVPPPRSAAAPWFMYLAFHLPHANDGVPINNSYGWGKPVDSDAPYSSQPWPQVERNHAAMVTHLDTLVGRVLDALDAAGGRENTITLFLSDNGATHNEGGHDSHFFNSSGPFRGAKACTWEGGFREPTIVRWPGVVPAGARSAEPWAYYDLMPTLLAAAGRAPPAGVQGVDVTPIWRGAAGDDTRVLFWRYGLRCADAHGAWMPAVNYNPPITPPVCCDFALAARAGRWKVRWWSDPSVPPMLFDILADEHEDNDVSAAHPELAAGIIANATAAYDVPNDMWPLQPCTTGGGSGGPVTKLVCSRED